MNGLAGRVARVTGAARGLGAAHARVLAQRGARVALVDLDLPDGDGLNLQADITSRERCEEIVEEIAYSVAFLASDEAAFITGQTMPVNGGACIVGI